MRETLKALQHFNSQGVNHLKIDSQRVFLNKEGKVRLLDFAFIQHPPLFRSDVSAGFQSYKAPEISSNSGEEVSFKADIWAVGIMLFDLCTGSLPYMDLPEIRVLFQLRANPNISILLGDNYSAELKDFLFICMKAHPQDRPDFETLLLHPFITQYAELGQETLAELLLSTNKY